MAATRWGTRLVVLGALVGATGVASARSEVADAHQPALVEALGAGLTDEQRAELRFLEHLGWRFVVAAEAKEIAVTPGTPCYRRDLESAWAGGDLRIAVPKEPSAEALAAFAATLPSLGDSVGSRCAYRQRLVGPVREATRKLAELQEKGDLTFPKLILINSPWFRCTLPEPEWKKHEVENLCTVPSSKGIEAVYRKGGVAECYTAQWLAIFAIQYELYGAAWFDEVFPKEELRIGRPREAMVTTVGQHVDESRTFPWRALFLTEKDTGDPGLALANLGPKAFVGLTGILQNDREDGGANQNLTFVSVSPRAVEEMKARGGAKAVLDLSTEALAIRKAQRGAFSASERDSYRRRYEAIVKNPVLSEVVVYIHPFGVAPLAETIEKELTEHARPMKLRIYANGLDDFLYQRYRTAWKARWLRTNASAPPAPPSASPEGA